MATKLTVEEHEAAVVAAIEAADADGVRIDVAHTKDGKLRVSTQVRRRNTIFPAAVPSAPTARCAAE